jgi:hypothetical protein
MKFSPATKDRRETVLNWCEEYARKTFHVRYDRLSGETQLQVLQEMETKWAEEQQAAFQFYRETR